MPPSFWPFGRSKDAEPEQALIQKIDPHRIPRHVAIIMDGNGRWAKRRGLPRVAGHRAGVQSLRRVLETCEEFNIRYLTVYAFSTENWKRPADEVNALFDLLVEYLQRELGTLHDKGVQIRAIGKVSELPENPRKELERAVRHTANNDKLILNVALNYGGRIEIVEAVKAIARQARDGQIDPERIDEALLNRHLYTADVPDPDLLIRPSGELRLSNFLLWQSAYTEIWVTPTLWPDFGRKEMVQALVDYQGRDRRFGGVKV
ncbi:undecaprenyl diphosphate synthase, putative [Heliomicrobium modesticaldum Ice1]|uniref:Isoprenyl transferase n=1 Tax=Heliobacterium modesticaldum (strain ATCC 51547 / Ice1) TaxID=498761 RepID=B0THE2_HELMI|nr:isoprenyl transferase [Heliomicrobium modesticaldum]ABZ84817.1 undecaprenyl diphosphate synthase, putative [Heliomicrobium modesticaldum Ice1]